MMMASMLEWAALSKPAVWLSGLGVRLRRYQLERLMPLEPRPDPGEPLPR